MTLANLSPSFDPATAAYLLRLACATTATWLAATLATLALRRASAALRHRLWSLATLTTLLLPFLIATLPERRVGPITLAPPTPPPPASIPMLAPRAVAMRPPIQIESADRPITATPARSTLTRTIEATTPTLDDRRPRRLFRPPPLQARPTRRPPRHRPRPRPHPHPVPTRQGHHPPRDPHRPRPRTHPPRRRP